MYIHVLTGSAFEDLLFLRFETQKVPLIPEIGNNIQHEIKSIFSTKQQTY